MDSSTHTTGGTNAHSSPAHPVPIQHDSLSFDGRHVQRIKEMEKFVIEEARRRKKDWEKDVEQMKEEFLHLLPASPSHRMTQSTSSRHSLVERCHSEAIEAQVTVNEGELSGEVKKRRGSLDVLDGKKMKTLFLEYPGAGMRYKLRFDISEFEPASVKITANSERITISAVREGLAYERKIEKPREVDHTKLRSCLTTDGILIIEAPLPPKTLRLRKPSSHSASPSRSTTQTTTNVTAQSSTTSVKSSGSQPGTPVNCSSPFRREKRGLAYFLDDESGDVKRRKMMLVLDIGLNFTPREITILIIKENRIRVKARHEERTPEKLSKNKFTKDFELSEKIETYSLRAGLTADGKLMVQALAKGHGGGFNKMTAGEMVAEEINCMMENQPCNVLDLSSFPPTTPQLIANSYNGVV